MTLPLAAVSQRVDILAGRGERRDALDQRLALWLRAAGVAAAPVPNLAALLPDWLAAVRPAAIVLSGGNDIGTAPERDATEAALLVHAERRHLPVLGICRGMQMMAVQAGAALVAVDGHVRTRHALSGALAGPDGGEVNSYHNHGLREAPPGYRVLARAGDGTVEAMGHEALPWQGWMWHPERESAFAAADLDRARALFAAVEREQA